MKTAISTLVAAVTFAVMAPAQADDGHSFRRGTVQPTYGWQHNPVRARPMDGLREINMRQAQQHERIERGLQRGVITRWEFRRLMAEQQNIQAMERAFVADGFLAPRERMELNRRLDVAASSIRFEATDHQRRFN